MGALAALCLGSDFPTSQLWEDMPQTTIYMFNSSLLHSLRVLQRRRRCAAALEVPAL